MNFILNGLKTSRTHFYQPIALMLFVFILPSLTYAQEGYYRLGKETLEFRLAAESLNEENVPSDWIEMHDVDGNRYQININPLIDSDDVEGISVDTTGVSSKEYLLTVYFKKKSWDKIYALSRRHSGQKLGVVLNHKLINAPLLYEAIDSSAGISGRIGTPAIKLFLDGLIKSDQPSKSDREKAYMAWLEARHLKKINNLNIDSELANKYLSGTKDYAKAAQLFETMLKKDPSKTENYMNLGICYAGLGKYNDAIKMYEKAIIVQPQSEWAFRSHIAELYFNKGDKQKATEELNKSILLLKKSSIPNKDLAIKSLESRLQDMKKALSHG